MIVGIGVLKRLMLRLVRSGSFAIASRWGWGLIIEWNGTNELNRRVIRSTSQTAQRMSAPISKIRAHWFLQFICGNVQEEEVGF
ncbi:hypothetical protein CEXT_141981 [Caerostris extrusa]|uniref:Secreted protein n=1 Tax=Caerostris extrusa TaxID=172846 RepID=A0AAV4XC15_CAEEX|nr:hypothetical protein CEXT_141981 [Caerostris extrusa]